MEDYSLNTVNSLILQRGSLAGRVLPHRLSHTLMAASIYGAVSED